MSEMNDRYSILGVKLSDRNQEISLITEEVKSCLKMMKCLSLFLEEKEKQMPKEGLPSKEAADKQLKYLKVFIFDIFLYLKHSVVFFIQYYCCSQNISNIQHFFLLCFRVFKMSS